MELIKMSKKELQRHAVIDRVVHGDISQRVAGEQLSLSTRQIKRLAAAYRQTGVSAFISTKRGRSSNRQTAATRRNAIMELVRQHYADFGATLACEYLQSTHGQVLAVETLRQWMIQEQLWTPKLKRRKRQHPSRERRPRLGELVQIDGSHHAWFEDRGPKCCLIAFIDDATGRVLAARFFPTETSCGYLQVLEQYVLAHGRPLSLYSDRHAIFSKSDPEDPKPTQFERALLQLDIESILALSPQAKGRVERLFQTLQDRLCKAMRLAQISDIDAANAWLDSYLDQQHNAKFAVQPAQLHDAHRPYEDSPDELSRICALHHTRQLGNGLSCQFEGQIIQLLPQQAAAPSGRAQVQIVQHPKGRLEVFYRGQPLGYRLFAWFEHLKHSRTADEKTLNERVGTLRQKHASAPVKKLRKLQAEIAHQEAQRAQGVYQVGRASDISLIRKKANPIPVRLA